MFCQSSVETSLSRIISICCVFNEKNFVRRIMKKQKVSVDLQFYLTDNRRRCSNEINIALMPKDLSRSRHHCDRCVYKKEKMSMSTRMRDNARSVHCSSKMVSFSISSRFIISYSIFLA